MVKEIKTPIFIFSSSFILGFFLSFYKFPFLILIFLFLGCFLYFFFFNKKYLYLSLWLTFLLIFYLTGYLVFKKKYNEYSKTEEIELLTTIEKVEPYYYGYINTAFSSSIGRFIFKTDKKYFSPGKICLLTFKTQ
ncbi:MAG: DNA uptake channel protein ComEC [Thermodesulfobacteria bacterium]|nr:DNA uptake channel protein ComEC [Thermodesulfobacteriota bacterium]